MISCDSFLDSYNIGKKHSCHKRNLNFFYSNNKKIKLSKTIPSLKNLNPPTALLTASSVRGSDTALAALLKESSPTLV